MTLSRTCANVNKLSPDFQLGVELEVFVRREDAERFIEEVRGDDPEMAAKLGSRSGSSRRAGRTETRLSAL